VALEGDAVGFEHFAVDEVMHGSLMKTLVAKSGPKRSSRYGVGCCRW